MTERAIVQDYNLVLTHELNTSLDVSVVGEANAKRTTRQLVQQVSRGDRRTVYHPSTA